MVCVHSDISSRDLENKTLLEVDHRAPRTYSAHEWREPAAGRPSRLAPGTRLRRSRRGGAGMPLRVGELLSACRCVGDASRDGGGSGVCRSPTVRKRKLTDSVQSCAFTAWFTGTIVCSSVPSSTWLLSLRDAAAALARAQSDIRRAGGVATAGRLLGHGAAARDVLAVGTRGSRPSGLDKRRTLGRRMPRHATTTRSAHAAEPPGTAGDRGRSLGARGTTRRPGEGFHGTAAPLPWKAGQLPWKGRPARVAARNRRGWPGPYQDASPTGWPRMRASGDRGVPI